MRDFLASKSVFTVTELDKYLSSHNSGNTSTRKSLLQYYQKQDRIVSVRRGLYVVVPPGQSSKNMTFDPYLIAAKSVKGGIISYHSALDFHGKAHTVYSTVYFSVPRRINPFSFGRYEFHPVTMPLTLLKNEKEQNYVIKRIRSGIEMAVTSLERTLVDVLDRPDLGGGWEEIWLSLETVGFFDVDKVISYTLLLNNATTAAKVGFYLDQHKRELMLKANQLDPLRKFVPRRPHYLDRNKRTKGRLVKKWNLLVPEEVINKSWEEVL